MPQQTDQQLPEGANALIALARVAHRDGSRSVEQSAVDRLARDYGIGLHFNCSESVDRELGEIGGKK